MFPVPCRKALEPAARRAASAVNFAELGRKLSVQTWGISKKIAEVDSFLRAKGVRAMVHEIHPEVCFWALAGKKPMKYMKVTAAGQEERREVLTRYEAEAVELLERALAATHRKDVTADDILDALVGFVTAEARGRPLRRLVGQPSHDEKRLPMEMVYLDSHGHPDCHGRNQGTRALSKNPLA